MSETISQSANNIFFGLAEKAKQPNKEYQVVPAGNLVARCYSIIDLGTQKWSSAYGDKEARKIQIGFEFPYDKAIFNEEKGEQPFIITQEFTLSFHEKASLLKFLVSWRGKSFTDEELKKFHPQNILNAPCLLNVIHNEKNVNGEKRIYANIASVSPLPKNMECPPLTNKIINFSLLPNEQGMLDTNTFDSLPEYIQNKIKSSPEYQALNK